MKVRFIAAALYENVLNIYIYKPGTVQHAFSTLVASCRDTELLGLFSFRYLLSHDGFRMQIRFWGTKINNANTVRRFKIFCITNCSTYMLTQTFAKFSIFVSFRWFYKLMKNIYQLLTNRSSSFQNRTKTV